MKKILNEIRAERQRQIESEKFSRYHDDNVNLRGELAGAASSYALSSAFTLHNKGVPMSRPPNMWPWDPKWFKPKSPREDLIRAAALIVAELERLDREEKDVSKLEAGLAKLGKQRADLAQ